MTKIPTKSPAFARHHVNAGMARIGLMLAFAGMSVAAPGADAEPSIQVSFVQFGLRMHGTNGSVLLHLANVSDKPFTYIHDTCLGMPYARFRESCD